MRLENSCGHVVGALERGEKAGVSWPRLPPFAGHAAQKQVQPRRIAEGVYDSFTFSAADRIK